MTVAQEPGWSNVALLVVHEASHAVVADRLSQIPSQLELWVKDDGFGGGKVSIPDIDEPEKGARWGRGVCLDGIAIALAGHAGVCILNNDVPLEPPDSFDAIDLEERSDLSRAKVWLSRVWPPVSERTRRVVLTREWRRTVSILLADWAVVSAIANVAGERFEERGASNPAAGAVSLVIEAEELQELLRAPGSEQQRSIARSTASSAEPPPFSPRGT